MLFQFLPHKKVILLWKKYKILLAWLGFEPMISRSEVHHANHYTIEASYKKGQIFHVESYNVLLLCEVKIKMHVTYNEWILNGLDLKGNVHTQLDKNYFICE